jgi:hypothetical protein
MKKIAITVIFSLSFLNLIAQVPAGFSYQAVVRNSSGDMVVNKAVKFKFSILQTSDTGTAVYVETQSDTTNSFGIVNLKVGMGVPVSGNISTVVWGSSAYFLKVELDPDNGNSFSHLGTTQLLSVPYALHARTVEVEADGDPANEIQTLSITGTNLSLSKGGGTVTLPSSGGGDNWGTDYVRTDATLAGQGTTAQPLKIAQQSAASGQVLKWNGTTWNPDDDLNGDMNLPFTGSVNTGGSGFSVENSNTTDGSSGIYGYSSSTLNKTYGVYGNTTSEYGAGVMGSAEATSGHPNGVFGKTSSVMGSGVFGMALASTGGTHGVWGQSESTSGMGVYGNAVATTGLTYGVYGWSRSTSGKGIYGKADAATGTTYGIYGEVNSASGYSGYFTGGKFYVSGDMGIGITNPGAKLEVAGQVKITGGNPGAGKLLTSDAAGLASWQNASGGFVLPYSGDYGGADAAFSINQSGTGNAIYVYNPAETGEVTSISAHNNSSSGTGIAAIMHAATGNATGISGFTASSAGTGVKGLANSGTGVNYGVKGESKSVEGVGVWGSNTSSTGITYGVQGSVSSSSGYSGYFLGGTFCVMSNVGIGSSTPSAKLEVAGQVKITGGTPGAGKVLTSDANGLASWATPASGQWMTSGSNIYFNTGNVGIGTSSPAAKLDLSASQGPNLIIRDSDGGSGRTGIQFVNNNIHYIAADDASEEVFGIYSGFGNNRTYAAKLNVHGPATNNWGNYIGLTHDGTHGRIYSDAGYLVLEPAGQRVGLGTDTPTQSLDVNGNARFRSIGSGTSAGAVHRTSDGTLTTSTSDIRLKENIKTLDNCLERVLQLRGVCFTWKSDPGMGTRIGFIAQEFEKIIPELVFTNESDGYKGINYAEISAVIVEAVKEQQKIIEHLKAENDRLKTGNEANSKELKKMREEVAKLNSRLNKMETLPGLTAEK